MPRSSSSKRSETRSVTGNSSGKSTRDVSSVQYQKHFTPDEWTKAKEAIQKMYQHSGVRLCIELDKFNAGLIGVTLYSKETGQSLHSVMYVVTSWDRKTPVLESFDDSMLADDGF